MKGRKLTFGKVIRRILRFFIGTLSMAVLYYVIFALIFSTDTERKLRRENRMYEQEYPELARKEALIADVVEGLKLKDNLIYEDARKEFSLASRTGFGVDGSRMEKDMDFEQVRGDFESNPFVQATLEHIEVKSALGDEIIARMRRVPR